MEEEVEGSIGQVEGSGGKWREGGREVTGGTYCFRLEEPSQRGGIFDEVTPTKVTAVTVISNDVIHLLLAPDP